MSIIDKLVKIDQRIIYALLFIALAFPILSPVVLPMDIQSYSQQAFDFSDSIAEGSIVIFEGGLGAATYPQGGPGMVVQIYHMLTKGVKIVFFSIGTEQNVWTMTAIETALAKLPAGTPAENGVDWVHLGYVAGQEAGTGALWNDIRATIEADYFDTPIDDIPLLEGINDASGFAAILWWGGSEGSMPYGIRQISVPFDIPITGMATTNEVPNFSPYISAAAETTVTKDLIVTFKPVTTLGIGKKCSKIIRMPRMAVRYIGSCILYSLSLIHITYHANIPEISASTSH